MYLNQALHFAERPEREPWMWFDIQSRTDHGIDHPGGHGERSSVIELDDKLFSTPIPRPPQDAGGIIVEGMISVIDRYRR
jgi:hypothetical protein